MPQREVTPVPFQLGGHSTCEQWSTPLKTSSSSSSPKRAGWSAFSSSVMSSRPLTLSLRMSENHALFTSANLFHVIVVLMQYVWVQGDSTAERVVNGLRLLRTAVKSMPEVWAAMMLRICLQPDMHHFAADVASALVRYSCERFPETFWLRLSTLIHKISAT